MPLRELAKVENPVTIKHKNKNTEAVHIKELLLRKSGKKANKRRTSEFMDEKFNTKAGFSPVEERFKRPKTEKSPNNKSSL